MLICTEDQILLREGLDKCFDAQSAIERLRTGATEGVSWSDAVDFGVSGLFVPEADGGNGFGLAGAVVVSEVLGRTLTSLPFIGSAVLGPLLLRGAPADLRDSWLPRLVAGEARFALAIDEGIDHAPERIEARLCERRLTAEKRQLIDDGTADLIGVVARDESGALGVCAVQRTGSGVTLTPQAMIDGSYTACCLLADAPAVPLANSATLDHALDVARVCLAAEMLGIAAEVQERTLAYLRERRQFDRPIGRFQALQHRMARLHTEVELARSTVMAAVEAIEAGDECSSVAVLCAKSKAGDVARLATTEALQLHGGMGMTDEFDIGFYLKRARVVAAQLGDSGWACERLARQWRL